MSADFRILPQLSVSSALNAIPGDLIANINHSATVRLSPLTATGIGGLNGELALDKQEAMLKCCGSGKEYVESH